MYTEYTRPQLTFLALHSCSDSIFYSLCITSALGGGTVNFGSFYLLGHDWAMTGPNLHQFEQAVQYYFRLCEANRDGTPNERSPSSETNVKGGRI